MKSLQAAVSFPAKPAYGTSLVHSHEYKLKSELRSRILLGYRKKPQTQVRYENAERHFLMAAVAIQTEMQEIAKHYVVMLQLTDTSLQSLDLEMNCLKFVIISGKVSGMMVAIIEGRKK